MRVGEPPHCDLAHREGLLRHVPAGGQRPQLAGLRAAAEEADQADVPHGDGAPLAVRPVRVEEADVDVPAAQPGEGSKGNTRRAMENKKAKKM